MELVGWMSAGRGTWRRICAPPAVLAPGRLLDRIEMLMLRGRYGAIVAVLAAIAPAAAQTGGRFDILEYQVTGNTVLPQDVIEETVYPFLGEGKTAADIEGAKNALNEVYAKSGYPTVSAELPRQDVSGGVVHLTIVERRVGRLRVVGARYFLPSDIRAGAPSLAEGRVPNLTDVQRDIVGLNQWPDRTVTPKLQPGALPGTVDVDLEVKDNLPFHSSVEINNRRSNDTTALRTTGTASYGNLFQRGDAVSVSYQVAPERPNDAAVMSSSYLLRIPDSTLSLLATYLRSNSNVSTVGGTGVIGRGKVAGVRLLVPLGSDSKFTSSLSVGFDYKYFNNSITLGADSTATPIQYAPLVVSYSAGWTGDGSQTDATATFTDNVALLSSNTAHFDARRYNAKPGFATLRLDASRTQQLPAGMQAYVHLAGQMTNQPVISNEQLSLGGLDSVRGYLESEALGDIGGLAQAELRSPSLYGGPDEPVNDVRLVGFIDGGAVAIRDALPQQREQYGLASVGAGARMRVLDTVNTDVALAHALSSAAQTHAGTTRFLFRVNGAF